MNDIRNQLRLTPRLLVLAALFGPCITAPRLDAQTGRPMREIPQSPRSGFVIEEDDPAVTWSGSWSTNPLAANSAGHAKLAMDAGARATFRFTGDAVTWIGYRDEWSGIATVTLDGGRSERVDAYASPAVPRSTLFSARGLGDGPHTLVIEVTGTRNKASGGSWVWVDGFSVTASPTDDDEPSRRDGRPRLIEQTPDGRRGRDDSGTDPREARVDMSWSGAWSTNRLKVHEGAEARLAMDPAAKASFSFVGSGVRWIGYQDEWSGIADVFVDGKLRATVDTYASPAKARSVLFAADDLDDRPHTLTIQPTGRRRKVSGGSWIWIDEVKVVR